MYPFRTLPDLLRYVQSSYQAPNALNYPHNGGWVSYSHREFADRVRFLTLALEDLGIERGERVGLIAPSSPDWLIIDLAIQSAGAICVPIFNKISPESFSHEVSDSGMRYMFAGNPDEIPLIHEHGVSLTEVITFWYSGTHQRYDSLFERGRVLEKEHPDRFGELCSMVKGDDLATIIYTSGSTG
ncbi:AMP-binding protein, partial [Salinispira pacifica]